MKKFIITFFLLPIILNLQGCIVAAVGVGIAAVKWANSKKLEAKLKCDDRYNNYMETMLKNHKKPISLKEYCDGDASTTKS